MKAQKLRQAMTSLNNSIKPHFKDKKKQLLHKRNLLTALLLLLFANSSACSPSSPILKTNLQNQSIHFSLPEVHLQQSLTFLVHHIGQEHFRLTSFPVRGKDSTYFQVTQKQSLPFDLETGVDKAVKVTVLFSPSKAGTFSASLQLHYQVNQKNKVHKITLSADVKSSLSPTTLLLDPSEKTIDFGQMTTRDQKIRPVTLSLSGKKPVLIEKLLLKGKDKSKFRFVFPPPTPFLVHPGKNNQRKLFVEVQSKTAGAFSAQLAIVSEENGTSKRQREFTYELKAQVEQYYRPAYFQVKSGAPNLQMKFLGIEANQESKKEMVFYNSGERDLKITKLELKENKHGAFQLLKAPNFPLIIKKNASYPIVIVYKHKKNELIKASLIVTAPKSLGSRSKDLHNISLLHEPKKHTAFFTCNNAEIDFGVVPVNTERRSGCSLRSTANVNLIIRSIQIIKKEGDPSSFNAYGLRFPIILRPNRSTFIRVYYRPKAKAAKEQKVILQVQIDDIKKEKQKDFQILLRGRTE